MVRSFELADLPAPAIRYGVGLWRRRWTVAAVVWASTLIGFFALWLIPDKYESSAVVYVQTESVLDPVMNGVTARPNYEKRVEVMKLQLLTRPNVEEIIYRAGLDKEVTATNPREKRAQMEKLIDWVAGEIKIASPQEMYFNIDYKNSDPAIARNVVDAALNLLIEQDLGASISENEEARKRLDAEIAAFDERLTAKEREVAAFRRAHAEELALVEGNDRRRDLMEADLSRVTDELAFAERRVQSLRNQLASAQSTSSNVELEKLLVELAALRSQYQENYPDIQAVKARIEQLQAAGANARPSDPEYRRISADLRAAQDVVAGLADRQKRLRSDLDVLAVTIGQAPRVVADLQRIERDYEQTRKNYEELIERRDRLSITANLGAGTQGVAYKIFEHPETSLIPAAQNFRIILIALVLLGSVGAGLAAAFVLTWIQKSFSQTEELKSAFGLPVLGALSEVKSEAVLLARKRDGLRLALASVALAGVTAFYVYWEVMRLPSVEIGGDATAFLADEIADAAATAR
ncbi:MAG TPA: Wzz/FepE/Etk N-terminal domain-containing protein [Parvularculaceae bacterium]|nr:Wzz/FepE/Etk N-terminal domain-containing protein [Parvularculaceae bacterium]